MMKRMNLQLFAESAGGAEPPAGGQNQQQTQTQTGQQASPAIDYAKIQQMLEWNRPLPHLSSRRRPSSQM